MIDIDHFRTINDRYGHEVGDRALQMVAAAFDENCRDSRLTGCYGGEEFVVLLEDVVPPAAVQVAERLRVAVEARPLPCREADVTVTVSVSIGFMTKEDRHFDDVLRRADHALYAICREVGRTQLRSDAGSLIA